MIQCAPLFLLSFTCVVLKTVLVAAAQNDTLFVGSDLHETKLKAPIDLVGSPSKKFKNQDNGFHDDFGDTGFKKSHSSNDKDGFSKFDKFHTKDGDGFGYEQHFEFGKKGGGKKHGGFHEASNFDDEDEAAGSMSPKFSEWHFEKESGSPAKSYRFESGNKDKSSLGKLVGPDYEGFSGSSSSKGAKRAKRKKDNVQPAATEYDNYEYADVEEADEPADVEGDEGADPEYGALYAEGDAYDYY